MSSTRRVRSHCQGASSNSAQTTTRRPSATPRRQSRRTSSRRAASRAVRAARSRPRLRDRPSIRHANPSVHALSSVSHFLVQSICSSNTHGNVQNGNDLRSGDQNGFVVLDGHVRDAARRRLGRRGRGRGAVERVEFEFIVRHALDAGVGALALRDNGGRDRGRGHTRARAGPVWRSIGDVQQRRLAHLARQIGFATTRAPV